METRNIPLDHLHSNTGQIPGVPENPRYIREDRFIKLKKSIQDDPEMLELRELGVYELNPGEYVVLLGNMRLKAMVELGFTEAPCKIIPKDTDAKKLRAYTIKDNVAFGDNNFEIMADKWDIEELNDWGVEIPDVILEETDQEKIKDDDFEAPSIEDVRTTIQRGDVFEIRTGNATHRLMCGDSTQISDVQNLVGGGTIDMLITDPPYNVDYHGGTDRKGKNIENDNMSGEEFFKFLSAAFAAAASVMKDGAAYYCWYASREVVNFTKAIAEQIGEVRQQIIWVKNTFTLGRQDYQWRHEPCLYGWKGGSGHYFICDRSLSTVTEDEIDLNGLKKDEMKRMLDIILNQVPGTVIHEDKPARNAEHPTMKPVKVFGRQILNSSRRGQNVLDLFGGSGTTIVAADQIGRNSFVMEYDPKYCQVIIDRIQEYDPTAIIRKQDS